MNIAAVIIGCSILVACAAATITWLLVDYYDHKRRMKQLAELDAYLDKLIQQNIQQRTFQERWQQACELVDIYKHLLD